MINAEAAKRIIDSQARKGLAHYGVDHVDDAEVNNAANLNAADAVVFKKGKLGRGHITGSLCDRQNPY